jgi:Uncharacterized protein conserved in bacteria
MKQGASSLVVGLVLTLCSLLTPEVTDAQQLVVVNRSFLVIYRPGPAWLPGKPVTQQPLKEHGKYMLSLYISGSMKLAGPLTDNAGGAVLLDVANEFKAKAIVAEDPAVKSGIFVYELHPWELKPWDDYSKKRQSRTQQRAPGYSPAAAPQSCL